MLRPKLRDIHNDYIINDDEILGKGVSGPVKTCTHRLTNQKYALKVLDDSPVARREIDLHWRSCEGCPYIVQIKDIYGNLTETGSKFFIIMEYLEGGALFTEIVRRKFEGAFTEREVAKIMYQICSAVKHLHEMGIAHRDLKPENLVFSSKDPSNAVIKLIDFGYANELCYGLKTPCYTSFYVPPEILRNKYNEMNPEEYDLSCDIWSLGVIMYILCCGYPPFLPRHRDTKLTPEIENLINSGEYTFPDSEWSDVSSEAKDLIHGMIQKIPSQRLTINQIMKNPWISEYMHVSLTPLHSLRVIEEDAEHWQKSETAVNDRINGIRQGLNNVHLHDVDEKENPVYKRRRQKLNSLNANDEAQLNNKPGNLESNDHETVHS